MHRYLIDGGNKLVECGTWQELDSPHSPSGFEPLQENHAS